MPVDYVFSIASMQACLASATADWFAKMPGDVSSQWQVERVDLGETTYFIHASDEATSRRIVIFDQSEHGVANARWMKKTVLERIHRAAIVVGVSRSALPREWHAYHHKNLLSFFGVPRARSDRMLRWTAEIGPLGNPDVLFWRLTPAKQLLPLESFRADHSRYEDAVAFWEEAIAEAQTRFLQSPSFSKVSLEPAVALMATFDATIRGRTYSEWLPYLSADQERFLRKEPPVKLRGPAGTGKTLCLLLKAIREVKLARTQGVRCQVLFLTHSWAMAAQIDQSLRTMDEDQVASDIHVFPLFSVGSLILNSKLPPGLGTLGEDSHAGKQEQFGRIRELLSRAVDADWVAYRSRCRPEFVEAVEADPDSDEHRLFAWGVMNEFACVLGPEGIVPGGYNAEQEYRDLPRSSWMMSLETEGEKDFLLGLYGHYIDELRRDSLISADQVVNDLVKDLEKSTWQYQRIIDGYDLLFIDELHLFNEQERRALHHLTRDPKNYPKMFMALDPRQSAEMVYTGVSSRAITRDDPGRHGQALSGVEQLSLTRVHRFGQEVLALLRHINKSWPQLDLGEDWELDLDQVQADKVADKVPRLYRHGLPEDEVTAALRACRSWVTNPDGGRVAVVLVDREALDLYEQAAADEPGRLNILRSRDDVASLQYEKRTVVLGPAEYVAGLQFDTVIVAGLPRGRRHASWPQTRYLLSQLYLAISRASSHVEIHVNVRNGGLPEVLESAIREGALNVAE